MTPAQILEEFRRKYEGTYVFVQMPDSKEENLFYLASVTTSNGTGVMRLESEDFGKIMLNMATAHTIKFAFPPVGVFQNGPDACLFMREPRRQWRRGLCSDNCLIVNVASRIDPSGRLRGNEAMTFSLVQNAYKGVVHSFAQAQRMLASGQYRSVALEDGFSLVLSTVTTCQYLLMHWREPVAMIQDGAVSNIMEAVFESQIRKITQ